MKQKNVLKDFMRYVSLNILGQFAYSCYSLTDTFFISANLGVNGLAALNLAFPALCMINGTGLMIGIGSGTIYSIQKSRDEHHEADRTFTNAVYLIVLFSLLFVLSGFFFSGKITKLLGANDTVFTMTNTYLRVMLLFAPAFLTNYFLQSLIRNDGQPSLSTAAMITGSLSNVVLDYIFIFPLKMGVFGAILATGLAPVISIVVLSPYFIKKKNHFHFIGCGLEGRRILSILSSGIPSFITEASSGIVMLIFNFIILRMKGNVGVAAYGVVAGISLVVIAMYTGVSQGIQPLISRKYGESNYADAKYILKYAFFTMLLLSGIIYWVIAVFAAPITYAFNSEQNEILQEIAETGLRVYFTACPFMGINIVLSTYFTSTKNPKPAHIISFLRGFIIMIPMAFFLSCVLEMTGVWCAFPATELIVSFVGFILYFINKIE